VHYSALVLFNESPSDHQGGQEQTHLQKVFVVIYLLKCYFCQVILYKHSHEPVFLLVYFFFRMLNSMTVLHHYINV